MRKQIIILGLWTVLELFGLCYARYYGDFAFPFDHFVVYTYNRLAEIENQCSPFLSSASALKTDGSRGEKLKNELSFHLGDWDQEYTGASLMPFNDRDMPRGGPLFISPWKLVSFEVTDVSYVHQSKTTVSLSGVLSIGIIQNSTLLEEPISIAISQMRGLSLSQAGSNRTLLEEPISTFVMRPGLSALRIDFEGVYFETEENGGERFVCLLGNATLPSRKSLEDSTDMMENIFDAAYDADVPLISESDQILLLLRYPRTFNVSSRRIHGEMTSLTKDDFSKYFDKVHISSQLRSFSQYQFSSGNLSSKSFDSFPLHDKMVEDGAIMFDSSEFRKVMNAFQYGVYHIVPNWKHGKKHDHRQNQFGPFLLGKEIKAVDSRYENVRISIQNIMCQEEETSQGETKIVKVSAVLSLVPSTIEAYVASQRTGLSELTLSVEGTWNSSQGQLRMVGCVGPRLSECDSQVLLYFPRMISINQRNMIFGSISSFKNETDSYTPILFGFELCYALIRDNWYVRSYLSYNYSKIVQASAFREISQPGIFIATVKQSLLKYPSLGEGTGLLDRLDFLSNDLRIWAFVGMETYVKIEVLSIGPLLRPLDLVAYANNPTVDTQYEISMSDILNISLTLIFTEARVKVKEDYYDHVSKLDLEGIYDPRVGTLYLVGCRNVLTEAIDIEGGRDCLIEVRIEYSSETLRWLINPTAKITITSQRNKEHPLHFTPIKLRTFMLHDRNHEESVKFRRVFEGGFRVLLLLVSVALIWSQMGYMKKNAELAPYVSLAMLGLQMFVYGSSLIRDKEILFNSWETKYYRDRGYSLQSDQSFLEALGYYMVKLLVLTCLILTARLFQLGLRARAELRAQGGPTLDNVPNEMQVLLISLVAFGVLSLLTLLDYWYLIPSGKDIIPKVVFIIVKCADRIFSTSSVETLFPQIVAHHLLKIRVKPLGNCYAYGFISITVVLIIYDNVRDPVDYPIYMMKTGIL